MSQTSIRPESRRQAVTGREFPHYPPATVQLLKDKLEQLNSHELAGDWATISTLEARLGMHAVTLTRLMEKIEVESEMRLSKCGR